jgi:hypothetical protein
LKNELIASNAETERVSRELDSLRSRALHENAQENLVRERELRDIQSELERCRLDRGEWERAALQAKVVADDSKSSAEILRRDLELERVAKERTAAELEAEREQSTNLQSVLQDFQSGSFMAAVWRTRMMLILVTAKEHELQQAVKDYQIQLNQTTEQLAEYKHRALTTEVRTCFAKYSVRIHCTSGRTVRDTIKYGESAGSRERGEREELARRKTAT